MPLLVSGTAVITRVGEAAARIRRAAENATTANEQRLAELDEEAARIEHAVAELASQHEPTAFAKSRHEDYRQHLGIVSHLRRDLEMFAAMLEKEDDGGLERVVLYIDDLDRCPPDVVVKVLEAIHLLMALPVFVVVVAVDPRRLHQAIRLHYAAMLPHDVLTPAHYLEKIFQIPFQLPEMDEAGFVRLVRGLSASDVVVDLVETPPEKTVEAEVVERDEPAPAVGLTPDRGRPALRPRRLDISEAELEFLDRVASLVTTPRAAKRLVNLYRLVRARLLDREIESFVASDQFREVLVLLALQAESGAAASDRLEDDLARYGLPPKTVQRVVAVGAAVFLRTKGNGPRRRWRGPFGW